jgi:membrane protease YdiL (CAAX protease family)
VSAQVPRREKRKRRPPSRASTWTVRYALSALAAVLVVAVVLGLAFRGDRSLALGVGGLLLDGFMLLTLVPLHRQHRLRARDLGLRPTAPARAVGLVVAAGILVAITNGLWLQGVLGKTGQSLGITLDASPVEEILIGFQMAVSAPVVEEIFFRGLLYRALRNRLSILPAALIAGFIFGAIHGMAYPLNTLPPRMVFGVITCLLYERTGSLYPSMALHGLIDGAAFEAAISGQIGIAYAVYGSLAVVLLAYAAAGRLSGWSLAGTRSRLRVSVTEEPDIHQS